MHNTMTTKRSTQRWHSGLCRGSAKSTLAYSTLWRPNGRGLQSTPFKRSKDSFEYHDVLPSLYHIPLARNLHNLEPLALTLLMFTKNHGVRKGMSNTHKTSKDQSNSTHTSRNKSSQHNSKSSQLHKSSICYHNETNARDRCLGA